MEIIHESMRFIHESMKTCMFSCIFSISAYFFSHDIVVEKGLLQ